LKLVNSTEKTQTTKFVIESTKKLGPIGKIFVMKSEDLSKVNSLEQPKLISPSEGEFALKGKTLSQVLAPYSFSVLRIKVMNKRN